MQAGMRGSAKASITRGGPKDSPVGHPAPVPDPPKPKPKAPGGRCALPAGSAGPAPPHGPFALPGLACGLCRRFQRRTFGRGGAGGSSGGGWAHAGTASHRRRAGPGRRGGRPRANARPAGSPRRHGDGTTAGAGRAAESGTPPASVPLTPTPLSAPRPERAAHGPGLGAGPAAGVGGGGGRLHLPEARPRRQRPASTRLPAAAAGLGAWTADTTRPGPARPGGQLVVAA